MKKAVNSGQLSVNSEPGLNGAVKLVRFSGVQCCYCKREATGMHAGRLMCTECRAEVKALDALYAPAPQRTEEPSRFERLCRMARKWLWVANAAFVGAALLYLGCEIGRAFVEWVELGGVR